MLAQCFTRQFIADRANPSQILGSHSTLQVGIPRDLLLLPSPYASYCRLWGVRRGSQLSLTSSSIFGSLPVPGLIPSSSGGISPLADPSGRSVSRRLSSTLSIRTPLSGYKVLTLSAAILILWSFFILWSPGYSLWELSDWSHYHQDPIMRLQAYHCPGPQFHPIPCWH